MIIVILVSDTLAPSATVGGMTSTNGRNVVLVFALSSLSVRLLCAWF
jgi:hypothetical protein